MNARPSTERTIFLKTLECATEDAREAYLQEACGTDAALRQEVESLLKAYGQSGDLLDQVDCEVTTNDNSAGVAVGKQIGLYAIREQIGEGGMGIVYVAEQKEPVRRKVALKIIKPGMDTKEVVARFEAERQALALMDHPNVAKVHDAGTTETGRPYFVMELVKGIPITAYCDRYKLSTEGRLKLFVTVCRAVQHAHLKGIIHRDIKPTNILVTQIDGQPVPKVIDFGVAKATNHRLTERSIYTQFSQIVGTPLYMSPEQAEYSGVDVDTRTDVYSLGALLYELLSGCTPFDRESLAIAGLDEMRRIIREDEPPRPSLQVSTLKAAALSTISQSRQIDTGRLSQSLKGELDWIVMKALDKDRNRRYESASSFAADVKRFLDDQPVEACPPSVLYRLSKFARRNKLGVAVAILLSVFSVGASITAFRFENLAVEARLNLDLANAETERANRESLRAGKMLERVVAEQHRAESNLELALQALDAVYLEAIGTEKLLGKGSPVNYVMADSPDAQVSDLEQELLKRGLEFYDQFAQRNVGARQAAVHTARAYYRVGLLQAAGKNNAAAKDAHQEAVRRFSQLIQEDPKNSNYAKGLARAMFGLANSASWRPDAKETFKKAADACSAAITLDENDALMLHLRSQIRRSLNQWDLAIEDGKSAVSRAPNNVMCRIGLVELLARAQDPRLRDPEEALHHARKASNLQPKNAKHHVMLANLYEIFISDFETALKHAELALDLAPQSLAALRARGRIAWKLGDYESALEDMGKAIQSKPTSWAYIDRAEVYSSMGKFQKAIQDFDQAESLDGNNLYAYEGRGEAHISLRQFATALSDLNKAVALAPSRSWTYKYRASALFQLGKYPEALDDIARAVNLNPKDGSNFYCVPVELVASCPDSTFRDGILKLAEATIAKQDTAYVRVGRARLLAALGDDEGALIDYNKAIHLEPDKYAWRTWRIAFFANRERWQDLSNELMKVLELKPADNYTTYQAALLSLYLDDMRGYRTQCQRMCMQSADSDVPIEVYFTAWTCALAADAVEDYAPVIKLARRAVDSEPENQQYQDGLGAILMRAGEFDEAKQILERALKAAEVEKTSTSYIDYFLAMTEHHLGNEDGAKEHLQAANESAEQELAESPAWNRKLTLELLRKEAEELITPDGSQSAVEPLPSPKLPEPSSE